jgi:hypothetical protein
VTIDFFGSAEIEHITPEVISQSSELIHFAIQIIPKSTNIRGNIPHRDHADDQHNTAD